MKIKRINKRWVEKSTLEDFLIKNDMSLVVIADYSRTGIPCHFTRIEDSAGNTMHVRELQHKVAEGSGTKEYEAIEDLKNCISGRSLVANGEYIRVPVLRTI